MNDIDLRAALDALEQRVSNVLRGVPGARELLLFGSRVTVRDDPYADLDLHLICADLAAARAVWPAILASISPIEVAWPLTNATENSAYSIALADVSPFHKLDISLGAGPGLPPPLDSATVRVIWRQEPPERTTLPPFPMPYRPVWGSFSHLIVEELFSGIRYLKARKRGRLLTAWRFVRTKPDLLLSLLVAAQTGVRPATPLSTWAIKQLEASIAAHELAAFLELLDWRTPAAMDTACLALNRRIAAVAGMLAERAGEAPPYEWIDRQLAFLEQALLPEAGGMYA